MRIATALVSGAIVCLVVAHPVFAQGPARKLGLRQLLIRLGEQVEAFRNSAPKAIADETLEQRSRGTGSPPVFTTRTVVSIYGYGGLPGAPAAIHEFRKVVSVDGKELTSRSKAREAISVGLKSDDDKARKKLLEDFQKHGLHGAVTDFGQVILLFSARRQKDYEFEAAGERQAGTDRALVLNYKQVGGNGGIMLFRGTKEDKQALQGELLLRETDGAPLRVTMTVTTSSNGVDTKDVLEVNYTDSALGCVFPVTVSHQEFVKDELVSENKFQYGPFRPIGEGAH
jgi:hypothetical protein